MKVKVLGAHNCESEDTKLVSLLIDDFLAIDAGGLTSSLSWPSQLKLKAILLSHRHYDHIRDIPAVAMNSFLNDSTVNVYSTPSVYEAFDTHLLNVELYPKFMELPQGNPTINFTAIEQGETEFIKGYTILALPVNHSVPTVGFQVASPDGKTMFYTADTGPGLTSCWEKISPHLLVVEVTAPNRYEDFAKEAGHLTPSLLEQELIDFRELKGYLPQVVTVHMHPGLEKEIEAEIAKVVESLDARISLAYEGMEIQL